MKIIILAVFITILIFVCAAIIFNIGCTVIKYIATELEKLKRFI